MKLFAILPLDFTSILVGVVVLLCVLWWMSTRRPPGFPPGPGPALPLLGHLHLLAKDPRPQFWRWRRQYGDVFSLYMGGKLTVVLASYSAVREALVTMADAFSDRPDTYVTNDLFQKKGIVLSSGPVWKEQRKASLEILRAMGMGKNVLAQRIQEEVIHYIRAIEDHQGGPVDLSRLTQVSVSNNICSILFGKRYDYQDPEFLRYLQIMDRNFQLLGATDVVNFIPALRHLPGDRFGSKELRSNLYNMWSFIDTHVARHRHGMDQKKDDTVPDTDFIHSYLQLIQKNESAGNVNSTLDDANLQKCIANLFGAGTETTSTTIGWTLLLFLHHPHVQDKCFQEIDDVIGPDRLPSMQDRPNLTYLEATICEVLRKCDIVPLSVPHATAYDVKFRGYVIPKGTVVIPFLTSVLQDSEIWGDPENFRPERFIGPDGKLIKTDEFLPFSTGRRVCLGESMARMELFLYLATLIQHFRFLSAEEGHLPSLEGKHGLTVSPKPYKIRAVLRK